MRANPRISGLPKNLHKLFRRALQLSGSDSQSQWLLSKIRGLIRQQQDRFGDDLLKYLTDEEREILHAIDSGAAELQHIVEESLLTEKRAQQLICDLIDRGFVEERAKGGKTEQARGAKTKFYFVTKKYTDLIK